MYIPTLKKVLYTNNVQIERALPAVGKINIAKGEKTEPFTRLGMSKISYKQMEISAELEFIRTKGWKNFYYSGEKIGKWNSKYIIAPFDGYLEKTESGYLLKEEDKVFWLLAGVWGEIANVHENKAVLIKTQTTDVHFSACCDKAISGELIVFPNPSEILEMQYLEKFEKYAFGKILYVGNYASVEIVEKAIGLGVVGILAGGADEPAFAIAKKNKIFLGLFSGFGKAPTPRQVFDVLKEVSNRYVFIQGERNLLRIPMPTQFDETMLKQNALKSLLKPIKKGLKVLVLQEPYFGYIGEVDTIKGSSIVVKLDENQESVEIFIPNIIAIE